MEIREVTEGDVLVLAPDGSIAGMEEAHAIETRLAAALKVGSRRLVLDCTAVGQLTSGAIRVLLMTSRKLDRIDGRLVLCGMNAKLEKAFSISGFNNDFTVVATREEAMLRVVEPSARRSAREARPAPPPMPEAAVAPPARTADPPPAPDPVQATPPAPAPVSAVTATGAAESLAAALIEALGVSSPRGATGRSTRPVPREAEAMATALVAALSAPTS